MANKNFFGRIADRFSSGSSEVKALKQRLTHVVDEFNDQLDREVKFLDNESSGFSGGLNNDYASIDQNIDTAALQRIYSTETWVYTPIQAIAKTIAGLPLKLEKRKEFTKKIKNELTGQMEDVKQEAWVDASGEDLFRIFQYPNKHTTKSELLMLISIDLLSAGEYYLVIDSEEDLEAMALSSDEDPDSPFGRLQQLMNAKTPIRGIYRIPPSLIKPMLSKDHVGIESYMMQTDQGSFTFHPWEIIHVKLPNPNNNFQGLSPLVAAFKPVLMDRFSTEHMIRFYKSGARLGGVIETEKSLNKEQLARFQRSFESKYTGRNNAHRTLILPPGMAYKPVGANPAEIALLEFCKYNREAVLAAFNVPPIKVGVMDHANYANALVQLKMFFTDTVIPLLTMIEDGFNMHSTTLPNKHVYRVKFDLSGVEALQENFKEKAEAAKFMIDAGLTVNEVRRRVWNAEAIEDGDKAKVIEDIKKGVSSSSPLFASAPHGSEKDAKITQSLSLSGPQVQAMSDIVKQVLDGKMPRESAVEMLITSFGIEHASAERIIGKNPDLGKSDAKEALPNAQADTALLSSIKPTDATFTERVNQLVQVFTAGGLPLSVAIPKAIEQARLEGFTDPDPNDPNGGGSGSKPTEEGQANPEDQEGKDGIGSAQNPEIIPTAIAGNCPKCKLPKEECKCDEKDVGGKPSLAEFLSAEIAKLDDKTEINDTLLNKLKSEYERQHGDTLNKEDEVKKYANGASKAEIVEHWKGFVQKTEPLVNRRLTEVRKFFDDFRRIVMKRFGADLKAYGMHKERGSKEADDILKAEAFQKLIDDYVDQVDKALQDAYESGYDDTLVDFKFEPLPAAIAVDELKKYAASKVTGIADTTRDQLRATLTEGFAAGKSMGDIGQMINEKFAEMSMGRAMTIARTETLTAVSMGKAAKRQQFKEEYPDKKLMKMWVTAQDDKVRDSHEELDGKSVEADDTFDNGLAYPRDPSGEAEEVINCRCDDITYAAEDQETIESTLSADESDDEEQKSADEAQTKIQRREGESMDDCVSRGIQTLIGEGKDQEQAAAIAYSMCGEKCTPDWTKGGPGSGRNPTGRHPKQPKGRKPSAKLSKDTAKLVTQREAGKGAPVTPNRTQLEEILNHGTFALISAGKNPKNADDMKLSDNQVKERYDKLSGDLKEAGYTYTPVEGHYSGKEDSFLVQVHSANKDHIVELGAKYNQDSVIYTENKKNEMIFTTGADKGKAIRGEGWSWQDNADDFYSEVSHSDGTKSKFQLNFNFDDGAKSFTISFSI